VKAITIRNLPSDLARLIRQRAKDDGTSINKTVINLLEEHARTGNHVRKRTRYRDLEALAGSWTKEEAAAFEKHLAAQRKIDRELWK
jgi:plasmid stability protein